MSNGELYAGGLLNRALDPATQPLQIRAFLQAEIALLSDVIVDGIAMVDVGCGTGRHLAMLRDRLRIGVGVDYEHGYIAEAHRTAGGGRLHFVTGDATHLPLRGSFDIAACLTNTWGTMATSWRCWMRCGGWRHAARVGLRGGLDSGGREWYQAGTERGGRVG
jgi:SAM-dependent methyltransferase